MPAHQFGKGLMRFDDGAWRTLRKGEFFSTFFLPGLFAVTATKHTAGRLLDGVTHDAMPGHGPHPSPLPEGEGAPAPGASAEAVVTVSDRSLARQAGEGGGEGTSCIAAEGPR
jgi:hypothetical protein